MESRVGIESLIELRGSRISSAFRDMKVYDPKLSVINPQLAPDMVRAKISREGDCAFVYSNLCRPPIDSVLKQALLGSAQKGAERLKNFLVYACNRQDEDYRILLAVQNQEIIQPGALTLEQFRENWSHIGYQQDLDILAGIVRAYNESVFPFG